jgi:hypothetical protein
MKKYSTREAADKIGVALITIQKHIALNSFPVPPVVRVHGSKVRLWTDREIATARAFLKTTRPGPKPKK